MQKPQGVNKFTLSFYKICKTTVEWKTVLLTLTYPHTFSNIMKITFDSKLELMFIITLYDLL